MNTIGNHECKRWGRGTGLCCGELGGASRAPKQCNASKLAAGGTRHL